jgi:hypothetical protein
VEEKRKVKGKKIEREQPWSEAANRVADVFEQYHSEDLPRIAIAALKQMKKRRKIADILSHLPRLKQFKQTLDQIHARRDQAIVSRHQQSIYTKEKWALLRLSIRKGAGHREFVGEGADMVGQRRPAGCAESVLARSKTLKVLLRTCRTWSWGGPGEGGEG